jgi:tetratricopeptide (TPR) repeat protein
MKRLGWVFCVMVLSHITGCAGLPPSGSNVNEQIDHWLSRQEYGKALATLAGAREAASPSIGDFSELQARVDAQIASFERHAIAEADRAAAAGDWETAFEKYRDALARLPDSTALRSGEQQLARRHAQHLERLELDRLVAQGELALKDLELSRLVEARNPPNWLEQYSSNRRLASAHALAAALAERGRRALEHNDLTVAKRVLPLASRLSDAMDIEALNARLQERLKDEELRASRERERTAETARASQRAAADRQDKNRRPGIDPQRQEQTALLLADFKRACHEKDFLEAQRLMAKLEKQRVDDPEFEVLSKELANEIATHVKHLTKIGVIHYSRQQYDEALKVWKRALALDPKNEQLTARIKRVKRVIGNLQNLRTKSGAAQ